MQLKILIYILISVFVQLTYAFKDEQLQLTEKIDSSKNFLQFSFHSSSLTVQDASVQGSGLKTDFIHIFKDKYSFQAQIMTSLQSSAESSMTALSLFANYQLFKSDRPEIKTLFLNEKKIMTELNSMVSYFDVGLGISQFYLNGTKGVYSLSGPALNLSYHFNLYSLYFNTGVQSASIQVEKKATSINTLFLGISLDL